MKSLAEMTDEVRALNTEKGWRSLDTRFAEYIALLHSEASEALEAYRARGTTPYATPEGKPDDVGSETS